MEKCSVCSKITLITGSVGGARADPHTCKMGTLFLMTLAPLGSTFIVVKIEKKFETFLSSCLIRFLLKIGKHRVKGIRKNVTAILQEPP